MSYEESLEAPGQTRPLASRALIAAHERRTERLAMLLDGARLRGLEQLHEYYKLPSRHRFQRVGRSARTAMRYLNKLFYDGYSLTVNHRGVEVVAITSVLDGWVIDEPIHPRSVDN
jgi:hypothetical protein